MAGSWKRCSDSGAGKPKSACTPSTSPTSPRAIVSSSATVPGRKRVQYASMQNTERSRARSSRSRVAARLTVIGFSTSTALPASSAARAGAWCWGWVVAT